MAAAFFAFLLLRRPAAQEAEPAPEARPTSAADTQRPPDPTRLVGRWQRSDGGYLLDVRGVAVDGSVDAAYFNPQPIHVASARANSRGGLGLFVELRDAGYPGSTYDLSYAPGPDRLIGTYFQAALGKSFEVEFRKVAATPAP